MPCPRGPVSASRALRATHSWKSPSSRDGLVESGRGAMVRTQARRRALKTVRHADFHDRVETVTVHGVLQRLLFGVDVGLTRFGHDIGGHIEVQMRLAIGNACVEEH